MQKASEPSAAEGRRDVDAAAERARLESFLIESKLSLLADNIHRAGISSLDELVRPSRADRVASAAGALQARRCALTWRAQVQLSRDELGRCAEDVADRISLQIAVDKKREELFPALLAPRALRWWSSARASAWTLNPLPRNPALLCCVLLLRARHALGSKRDILHGKRDILCRKRTYHMAKETCYVEKRSIIRQKRPILSAPCACLLESRLCQ